MPPEVETLEETAILETPIGAPEGDAGSVTKEPDYKAEYERLTAELATEKTLREKVERDQRARDIQLLSQKKQQEILTQTHAMTKDIFARLIKGEIDEDQAQIAITQGVSKLQEEAVTPPQEVMRTTLLSTEEELTQGLLTLGLGKDDAGKVEITDARANHLNDLWDEALKAFREKRYEASEAWRDSTLRELKRLTTSMATEQAKSKAGLGLNERNGRGAAAGMSDQALVNRYAQRAPMSTAESLRAIKAMDNGIYPQ